MHIIPNIGNIRLSSLTIMQVQKMMNAIIDNGGSTRATNLVKIVMSKALKPAEADRLVNSDIMRHVKVNKYIPRTRQVLNADEIKTFVNAIKCEKYRFIYMMCLTYGLRRGKM